MLKFTRLHAAPRVPFQVDGRIMLTNSSLEVIHLTLKPGETIPRHVNDFDVAMFIVEGHGRIETDSMSADLFAGTLAEINAGEERGLACTGNENLIVLVLKFFC